MTKSISICFILTCLLIGFNSGAQPGNALHFDGANDRVYVGNSPVLNTPHLTVQAWIKIDHLNGWSWRGVVTKRNCCGASLEQWTMQTTVGGYMDFFGYNADLSSFQVIDPNPVPVGIWTNFSGTYNGHEACLYRNGILVGKDTTAEGDIAAMGWPVVIGDRDGTLDWFPGSIDEVRIWDHALTQDEILYTMNCELTGNESGLIAYYNFNEGVAGGSNQTVTTLPDLSPNNLDGTLQNFALTGSTSNWVASDYPDLSATITSTGPTTVCKPSTVTLIASPASNGLTYQWKKGNTIIDGATDFIYTTKKSGTYKCLVTNACGSATSNSIPVTINAQPTATITPSGTVNMCAGQTTVLTANAGNNLSYQWKKGSTNLSGATNQTYNATTAGKYKVIVTNTSTGCSKTSKATTISITCKYDELKISDRDSHFSVYPNPGNGKFFIEFSSDKIQDADANVHLVSVTGQLMFEEVMLMADGKLQEAISLPSTLPDGIYFLQISVNDKIYREKLVLKK